MVNLRFMKVTTTVSPHRALICLYVWASYLMQNQLVLSKPVSSSNLQCNSPNKNPCEQFPSLCSEGGGLCIFKGPCEYQCVCPPDGRVARDCTSDTKLEPGLVVPSLLFFPPDFLSDTSSSVIAKAHNAPPAKSETETVITTTPAKIAESGVTKAAPKNPLPRSPRSRPHKNEVISADDTPEQEANLTSPPVTTTKIEDSEASHKKLSSATTS